MHILVRELKGSDLRPGDTTSSFAKSKPTLFLAGFSSSCTACPGETEFASNLAFIEPLRQSNRGQNVPLLTLHEEKKGGFGVPQSLPSDMTDNPSSSREREDELLHRTALPFPLKASGARRKKRGWSKFVLWLLHPVLSCQSGGVPHTLPQTLRLVLGKGWKGEFRRAHGLYP